MARQSSTAKKTNETTNKITPPTVLAFERKLAPPTVLAFERKLAPSDAILSCGNWDDRENSDNWEPVVIREKTVRGTMSHFLKGDDVTKLEKDIKDPNPQTVDVAMLPWTVDTLKVQFSLRILSGVEIPVACNGPDYRTSLTEVIETAKNNNAFEELARRYAFNLANGRFLWRNRMGAQEVEVVIRSMDKGKVTGGPWTFDALALPLQGFSAPPDKALDALSDLINKGLSLEQGKPSVLFDVTAFARLGHGQEVFPSEELIMESKSGSSDDGGGKGDTKSDNKSNTLNSGKKSKTLYSVDGVAGIHSQKLGNAIRTIDTWYADSKDLPPIAVDPYGAVTPMGMALRPPKKKQDFYSLLDKCIVDDTHLTDDEQYFVMAVLIRGGVFSRTTPNSRNVTTSKSSQNTVNTDSSETEVA